MLGIYHPFFISHMFYNCKKSATQNLNLYLKRCILKSIDAKITQNIDYFGPSRTLGHSLVSAIGFFYGLLVSGDYNIFPVGVS